MSAREQLTRAIRAQAAKRHQAKFRLLWSSLRVSVELAEEVKVVPDSGWRFDFAHHVAKVAIEIQGGIWREKGAHNTGGAILRDTRKARAATLLGWAVIQICPEDINAEELLAISRFVTNRAIQKADPYKDAR